MAEIAVTPKRKNRLTDKVPDKISYMKTETRERRLSLLYLIHSYLIEQKLFLTSEAFEKECQLSGQYEVCENVDLEIILQEFQSYYYTKFQKYARILKKADESHQRGMKRTQKKKHSSQMRSQTPANVEKGSSDNDDFHFEIVSYPSSLSTEEKQKTEISEKVIYDIGNFSSEWKDMANQIMKECFVTNLQVNWNDCIGLENSTEKIKETMVYPLNYPYIFKNIDNWKGFLLFGPPGNGKTLLAKAVASENTTFINVCSSIFTSKWRGDSEKMLKVLFDLAKYYAPTTIFLDEIDSIVFSTDLQHDASKRFRSEFLTQVDGILGPSNHQNVFLLGCTNLPWNLDAAILRRFEKRLLITLPDKEARKNLLKHYLPTPNNLRDQELEYLANLTENFSCSDMKNLCKEATMCPVREKIGELKIRNKTSQELRNVTYGDIEQAFAKMKPCITSNEIRKYFEWNEKYGSW